MFFSGSNLLVKLYGGPYPYPKVTSTFVFPVSKLQVTIEQGELRYLTADGRGVNNNPQGFCWDDATSTYTNKYLNEVDCNTAGLIWKPYVTATSVTDVSTVKLNNIHLSMALQEMLDYYKSNNVNRQDYDALSDWVHEVTYQASLNKTWRPNVGNQTGEILDAVAIQFGSEQASSPIYNPGNMLMDTQMRGTTMINGVVSLNYKSDWNRDLIGFDGGLPMNLEVIYNKDEFELEENLEGAEYEWETNSFNYLIHDVEFIGRSHSTTPSPENVIENYQFIARALTPK